MAAPLNAKRFERLPYKPMSHNGNTRAKVTPMDGHTTCSPRCDMCVVTFNSAESVPALFKSLSGDSCLASVRVLDNASEDRTCDVIGAMKPLLEVPLHLELAQINVGFPVACNRIARRCAADVIAVVNPDIEFTPGALARLVEVVSRDESIGIATCRLMERSGRVQTEAARARPRLRRLVAGQAPHWFVTWVRRRRGAGALETLFMDRDIECMSGALMVMRRELFEELGYLDESVFMYLEDIDFAARVRAAGYRIRYLGTTWVWHDSGVSSRGRQSELFSLLPKVWLTYLKRYGRRSERLVARPVLLVVCVIAVVKRLAQAELPRGELVALWLALVYRPIGDPVYS